MVQSWEIELGSRKITLETGHYAKQANGSVVVKGGDSVVLVTATMSDPRPGVDFLPLMVNFEERVYAIGRIPGSWNRREGRPRDVATLNARLIDRPLRPLFPDGFRNDVQIIATVLSVDPDYEPEMLAFIGASASIIISDIPFTTPIGGIKVGMLDNEFVVNPTEEEREKSKLELIIAGTKEEVTMVEACAHEIPEDKLIEALEFGQVYLRKIVEIQEKMRTEVGKEKAEFEPAETDQKIVEEVQSYSSDLNRALRVEDKLDRQEAVDMLKEQILEILIPRFAEDGEEEEVEKIIKNEFEAMLKDNVRQMVIKEKKRPDGRDLDEVRNLHSEVSILPRVHGSAEFTRGQTQALSVLTLGAIGDSQIMFDLGEFEQKRFMLHYNFPPYSVGETWPMRPPGRREIGHGALGEKAIEPILPDNEEFPYTIRLVSEILESNGSTSQASICASSLALMDGGVPLKNHVAGIAMGLMKEGEDYAVLSDIQGLEDFYGDMDFKVAGTRNGVTALQMDIKIKGISREIMEQALMQARKARLEILDNMEEAISEPRSELSPYAPRMISIQIDPEQIREIIGPQGKTIRKITEETETKIDIEDTGKIFILGYSKEDVDKAIVMIEELTRDVEVGETYMGTVKRLMNFGAFVEVLPGKEGLVHISRLADYRVRSVEDVVSVGDKIWVKVTEIDDKDRINLSREAVLKEKGSECMEEESRNPQPKAKSDSGNSERRNDQRRGGNRSGGNRDRR